MSSTVYGLCSDHSIRQNVAVYEADTGQASRSAAR